MDIISQLRTASSPSAAQAILSNTQPKIGTVAKLTSLAVPDTSLLFDIKRKGDWEQMMLYGLCAITGDRFAAALRKALRRKGMYHSVRGIKAWRGTEGIDEEELEARSRKFRTNQILSKLAIINGVRTGTGGVLTALRNMRDHVNAGATSGYVFSPPIAIPSTLQGLISAITTNQTGIASTFATYIMRARMVDIRTQIDSLIQKIGVLNLTGVGNDLCTVNPPSCATPPTTPPTTAQLDAALTSLESFIKTISELEALNIQFTDQGNVEPIDVKLFENNGRLIKGASSAKFNFSANPYNHPETGLATTVARLLVHTKARRPDAVAAQINKLLVQYFVSRDAAKEAFFSQELKTELETRTDITNGLTPAQVVGSAPLPSSGAGAGGGQGLLQVLLRFASPASGGSVLHGGNPPPPPASSPPLLPPAPTVSNALQYRDIHDLFLELCYEADVAMDRVNASGAAADQDAKAALDTIEARWTEEIAELRSQSLDDYGVAFNESFATDYVSNILSYRARESGGAWPTTVFDFSDPQLYGPARSQTSGQRTQLNDAASRLATSARVEITILKALQRFLTGQLVAIPGFTGFKRNPRFFEGWGDDGTLNNWSGVPTVFGSILIVVTSAPAPAFGLGASSSAPSVPSASPFSSSLTSSSSAPSSGMDFNGGSLQSADDISSNAGGSSSSVPSGGRRGLYARLRKRSGSGSPPGLRE
jgi:hypothetical protein